MSPRPTLALSALVLCSALAPPVPAAPAASPALERSYALSADGAFKLSTESGDVSITRSADGRASVKVTLAADRSPTELDWREIETGSGRIVIELRQLKGASKKDGSDSGDDSFFSRLFSGEAFKSNGSLIASVEITVPAHASSEIATGAGDMHAADLGGKLALRSGAGDIHVERITADTHVSTGVGDVKVATLEGTLEIDTGAGDISITEVARDLDVRTGTGDVSVTAATGTVRVNSGSGDLSLDARSLAGPSALATGVGDISVRCGGTFDLEARTGIGDVVIRDGSATSTAEGAGSALHRKVGEGGPRLSLSSGAGDISVTSDASVAAPRAL